MSLFLRRMRGVRSRAKGQRHQSPAFTRKVEERQVAQSKALPSDSYANPMLDNGLAMAAQDISAPLDLIAGAAWNLKEGCSEEDRQFWVDCILLNAVAAQNAVEDFKDEVCEEAGLYEVRLEEINLSEVVREAVNDFVPLAHDHTLRFYGDDAWVLGDAFRIQRLVFNLLSNAIKHSEAGREIKVDVWRRGTHVCLFVQDQGRGAVTSENECMFLPFRSIESGQEISLEEEWSLACVKRIADAHGATVKVQGVAGQGSIFEVSFKALCRTLKTQQ